MLGGSVGYHDRVEVLLESFGGVRDVKHCMVHVERSLEHRVILPSKPKFLL